MKPSAESSDKPVEGLRSLIIETRQDVARQVNSALVMLYWHVGKRIRQDILKEKRGEYGEEIVPTLSAQLGWSHLVEIIPLRDELQRDFYAEMCRVERWSVRILRQKISSMLFERTALSRKPVELAKQELVQLREEDRLTPDLVFRDPYFLDFLGLKDTYSEKDLKMTILRELESFILEMGVGSLFRPDKKGSRWTMKITTLTYSSTIASFGAW